MGVTPPSTQLIGARRHKSATPRPALSHRCSAQGSSSSPRGREPSNPAHASVHRSSPLLRSLRFPATGAVGSLPSLYPPFTPPTAQSLSYTPLLRNLDDLARSRQQGSGGGFHHSLFYGVRSGPQDPKQVDRHTWHRSGYAINIPYFRGSRDRPSPLHPI